MVTQSTSARKNSTTSFKNDEAGLESHSLATEYPKRPSFFANNFIRFLMTAEAAKEIEPIGCWLLAIVAMKEDEKRYCGPVGFWNDQLVNALGISEDKLAKVRTKAVNAGWLRYQCGNRSKNGTYFVTIPSDLQDWFSSANSGSKGVGSSANSGSNEASPPTSPPRSSADKSANSGPSMPLPNPNPKKDSGSSGSRSAGEPETTTTTTTVHSFSHQEENQNTPEAFQAEWCKIDGVTKAITMPDKRRKKLLECFAVPGWIEQAREAMKLIPTSDYLCGRKGGGSKRVDIDWFIADDNIIKILEGHYHDGSKHGFSAVEETVTYRQAGNRPKLSEEDEYIRQRDEARRKEKLERKQRIEKQDEINKQAIAKNRKAKIAGKSLEDLSREHQNELDDCDRLLGKFPTLHEKQRNAIAEEYEILLRLKQEELGLS